MFLKNLSLFNYRNYEECFIEFDKTKTIIIGENAIGKTNILESVFYLANLDSFRTKSDKELLMWKKDFARVKGVLNKYDTDIELDVWINPPKRKTIKINGIKKSKYFDFLNNLSVIKFGVDDILLLRGAPADRRKWLDVAITQIYPAYFDRLQKFNKIKDQRNNLLKNFMGNIRNSDNEVLKVFDEQLIVTGSNIIFLREKYLKEILPLAKEVHNKISNKDEKLNIQYQSTVIDNLNMEDEIIEIEKIAENFKEIIEEKRNEEIIRAKTLVGPHRDDILFFINEIDALLYASQGQQRTIVLSLKLGELELIKQKIGENPVLLLDDVLAELDSNRQNYLLDTIHGEIQTIITSTDINNFKDEFLKDVDVLKIENGSIIKQ